MQLELQRVYINKVQLLFAFDPVGLVVNFKSRTQVIIQIKLFGGLLKIFLNKVRGRAVFSKQNEELELRLDTVQVFSVNGRFSACLNWIAN